MDTVNLLKDRKIYKTDKEILYWDLYLRKDVEFVKTRRHYHYYNEIPYTRWPFYISEMLFFGVFFGLLFLNGYNNTGILSIISFVMMVLAVGLWFYDLLNESMMFGKYNRKLRSVIVAGFMLFLASEVFLFGGFFWAFFDRFFHTPAILGGESVPMGMEVFVFYKKPLYATIILLFSAITFNGVSYCMKWGSWTFAVAYSTFGLLLGCVFLVIQVSEYKHLSFNITDTVYGSCFYLLTGFHGFHVVVGLVFLTIQHERLVSWHFSRERHLGYSLAMIYWHFVDIVWIFLFIFVYVFNSMGYQYFLYVQYCMFYFFYVIAILSSVFMIMRINPINAVLFLIMVFVSVAMIFLLCNLEFIALIFIIVYVGAIAVLFLFIVMMINIKKIEKDNSMYLTIGIVVVLLFAFEMLIFMFNDVFGYEYLSIHNFFDYISINNLDEVNRLYSLVDIGIILFYVRPFLVYLAGLILLVAMIGAIYLTNVKRGFSMKKQFNQLSKDSKIHHVNFY